MDIRLTQRSLHYRRKASLLGRRADEAGNSERKMEFLLEALHWIQLAENEELISEEPAPVN